MLRRVLLLVCIAASGCNPVPVTPADAAPRIFLWAWERNEDLRFADADKYGVAFLAQTLTLSGGEVIREPRRQPLKTAPDAYLIAVTRIESSRDPRSRPTLSATQRETIVKWIRQSADLPKIRGVQVDFDALSSEHEFYREMIVELRNALPTDIRLSITALASWCIGDRWLDGIPIDDAVPMLFDMGPDGATVTRFLNSGSEWPEPLCRQSYGLSVESPRIEGLKRDRRIYVFKSSAWSENDIKQLQKIVPN